LFKQKSQGMINQIHPNKIRQILFISVLIALGLVIALEMFFMLGAFLGAVTLYVLMRNAMIHLVVDYKWKTPLAALFLMVVSLILLVMPVAWLTSVVIDKLGPVMDDPQMINRSFEQINAYLLSHLNVNIFSAKNVAIVNEKLVGIAQWHCFHSGQSGHHVFYALFYAHPYQRHGVMVETQYAIKAQQCEHCDQRNQAGNLQQCGRYTHRGSSAGSGRHVGLFYFWQR